MAHGRCGQTGNAFMIQIRLSASNSTSLDIDLGQVVATSLGGEFFIRRLDNGEYLGLAGWQAKRYLFQPTVKRLSTTVLATSVPIRPPPGLLLAIELPQSSFRMDFEWPAELKSTTSVAASVPAQGETAHPAAKEVKFDPSVKRELDERLLKGVESALRQPAPASENPKKFYQVRKLSIVISACAVFSLLVGITAVLWIAYGDLYEREIAAGAAHREATTKFASAETVLGLARTEATATQRERSDILAERARLSTRSVALDGREKQINDQAAALDRRTREIEGREAALNSQPSQPSTKSAPTGAAWPTPTVKGPNPVAATPSMNDVDTCDQLAANPNDRARRSSVPGLPFAVLKQSAAAAVTACESAHRANPQDDRIRYQLARAYQAAGQQDAAYPHLRYLTNSLYWAAFDNFAQYHFQRGQSEAAVNFLRRGADLGDPDAMVNLASAIEKNLTSARRPDEPLYLLTAAANLGHTDAIREINARQNAGKFIDLLGNTVRTLTR